jgi:hypothetical protein
VSKESAILIFRSQYGYNMFLRKVSTSLQEWTASHSSRRETQRDAERHREGQIVPTLLFAKARRFQFAILSEQTVEWFCNVARTAAGVAGVLGLAACLLAVRCRAC